MLKLGHCRNIGLLKGKRIHVQGHIPQYKVDYQLTGSENAIWGFARNYTIDKTRKNGKNPTVKESLHFNLVSQRPV